tara:strand:+ start:10242 stop:10961 length:720 start_codon:yes stop_codon:yes gene_type:complete
MNKENITFIIPAAGKSNRFNTKKSKIYYKYKNKILIFHVIDKCLKFSKNIFIISNKQNLSELKLSLKKYKKEKFKIIIQNKPKGMGHAVNLAMNKVKTKYCAVIWADQIYLNIGTIRKTLNFFEKKKSVLCFPFYKKKSPYAYIIRDKNKKFKDIKQTRELNKKISSGESDCGFFVFRSEIMRQSLKYLVKKKLIFTRKTKEIDFIQSFKFLNKFGPVDLVKAKSIKDTMGINSLEDLI